MTGQAGRGLGSGNLTPGHRRRSGLAADAGRRVGLLLVERFLIDQAGANRSNCSWRS
jgi:hypothetical protein